MVARKTEEAPFALRAPRSSLQVLSVRNFAFDQYLDIQLVKSS